MGKTVKIIVAGNGGVGKTSLLRKLIYNKFDPKSELTKGFDFFSEDIIVRGVEYNIIFWYLAGQPHFRKILTDIADGAVTALILFDLTRISSIEGIEEWKKKVEKFGDIPIILLGTKYDMIEPGQKDFIDREIQKYKNEDANIIDYMKTSSKTGFNVKKVFELIIERITSF